MRNVRGHNYRRVMAAVTPILTARAKGMIQCTGGKFNARMIAVLAKEFDLPTKTTCEFLEHMEPEREPDNSLLAISGWLTTDTAPEPAVGDTICFTIAGEPENVYRGVAYGKTRKYEVEAREWWSDENGWTLLTEGEYPIQRAFDETLIGFWRLDDGFWESA